MKEQLKSALCQLKVYLAWYLLADTTAGTRSRAAGVNGHDPVYLQACAESLPWASSFSSFLSVPYQAVVLRQLRQALLHLRLHL